MSLDSSSSSQSPGWSREFKPEHPTAADAVPKADTTTQVLPDRRVIFRLLAPGARQVSVLIGFSNPPTVTAENHPLKKDGQGLWSTLLVYTPAGYDEHRQQSYPVLYLYHGYGDTVYSWVTDGRVHQIMDNAIADGSAFPMMVVIPDTHALDPDRTTRLEVGRYLNQNVVTEDRELFEDIIPFVNDRFRVQRGASATALAGLSMGGFQTVYSGFVHSDRFSMLGVFSAGVLGEPEPLEQALQAPEKIRANISYLYVTTGGKDPLTGPSTKEFIARLDQLRIPYTYEEYPDEVHSMDVWRPSLHKFVARLFRPTRPNSRPQRYV
jgi:enterochelin esterase family protein